MLFSNLNNAQTCLRGDIECKKVLNGKWQKKRKKALSERNELECEIHVVYVSKMCENLRWDKFPCVILLAFLPGAEIWYNLVR
jgi:hypothetical protein